MGPKRIVAANSNLLFWAHNADVKLHPEEIMAACSVAPKV